MRRESGRARVDGSEGDDVPTQTKIGATRKRRAQGIDVIDSDRKV
jgi:hypothetical protein